MPNNKNLTISKMSEKAGLSKSLLSKVFNGKARCSLSTAQKLADNVFPESNAATVMLTINEISDRSDYQLAGLRELLEEKKLSASDREIINAYIMGLKNMLTVHDSDYPVAPDVVLANQREPEIEPDSGYPIPPSIVMRDDNDEQS